MNILNTILKNIQAVTATDPTLKSGSTPSENVGLLTATNGAEQTRRTSSLTSAGPVPDVQGAIPQMTFQVVMDSLRAFMPKGPNADNEVALATVLQKLRDVQSKNAADKIHADMAHQRSDIEDQKAKMEEAAKKMKKASRKKHGVLSWVKASFQMLGAVMALAMGAAFVATGAGAPLGALLITAGVIGIVMATDSMVKMNNGGVGIMGAVVLKATGDEDRARKADMGFGIAMTALALATAVAMFIVPGGQVSAVQNAATAAQNIQRIQALVQTASQIANSGVAVFSVGAGVAEGVLDYQAANLRADALSLRSEGKKIGASLASLDDQISMSLAQLMDISDRFNHMFDALQDTLRDKASTATRRFVG